MDLDDTSLPADYFNVNPAHLELRSSSRCAPPRAWIFANVVELSNFSWGAISTNLHFDLRTRHSAGEFTEGSWGQGEGGRRYLVRWVLREHRNDPLESPKPPGLQLENSQTVSFAGRPFSAAPPFLGNERASATGKKGKRLQMGYWEILRRSTSNLRDGVLVGRCALRLKTRVQDPVFGP